MFTFALLLFRAFSRVLFCCCFCFLVLSPAYLILRWRQQSACADARRCREKGSFVCSLGETKTQLRFSPHQPMRFFAPVVVRLAVLSPICASSCSFRTIGRRGVVRSIVQVDGRVKEFDEKIKGLDTQLRQIREQMKKAKGPQQNTLKQRALKILKQKKMCVLRRRLWRRVAETKSSSGCRRRRRYENQRDVMMQQSFNMEQQNFGIQSLRDTVTTVRPDDERRRTTHTRRARKTRSKR